MRVSQPVRDALARAPWPLLKKAVNQWVDGPDDRLTRLGFVVGDDLGAAPAVATALGALDRSWAITHGWPLTDDGHLHGPDATALAAWLVPADVLWLAVPAETARLAALLDAHSTARAAWVWRPWRDAVRAALHADPAGAATALRAARAAASDTLRAQFDDLIPDASAPPALAAALTWYARHGAARAFADDPRVTWVPADRPEHALESLVAASGLPGRATPTLPPVPPGEAPTLDAPVVRLCDALEAALRDDAR